MPGSFRLFLLRLGYFIGRCRHRPDHVAAVSEGIILRSRRCWPRIAAVVFAIFVDGIEQETAVGVKAISEGLTVDKILRRVRKKFRDERGEGRREFAVVQSIALQRNRGVCFAYDPGQFTRAKNGAAHVAAAASAYGDREAS